jgi:hypothetical protein
MAAMVVVLLMEYCGKSRWWKKVEDGRPTARASTVVFNCWILEFSKI